MNDLQANDFVWSLKGIYSYRTPTIPHVKCIRIYNHDVGDDTILRNDLSPHSCHAYPDDRVLFPRA